MKKLNVIGGKVNVMNNRKLSAVGIVLMSATILVLSAFVAARSQPNLQLPHVAVPVALMQDAFGDFSTSSGRPFRPTSYTEGGVAGSFCGGNAATQNANTSTLTFPNVPVCFDKAGPNMIDSHVARAWPAGDLPAVSVVRFGIGQSKGGDVAVDIEIYQGAITTIAPGSTNALRSASVTIPAGTNLQFFEVDFDPPFIPDPAEPIVVAIHVPDTAAGVTLYPGGNTLGQIAPSYLASDGCATPTFVDMAAIGLPNAHLVLEVCTDAGCAPCGGGSCPADLTSSGTVGVPDLLTLLGNWGLCTSGCPGCPGDLTCSGGVGVPDLLTLLSAWGPCPAVPLPTVNSISPNKVGITGQVWIQGTDLGDLDSAVVVFDSYIVAADVEHHTPNEVVLYVPFGTVDGLINIVTGVDGNALREMQVTLDLINGVDPQGYDQLADDLEDELAGGTWSNDAVVTIIDAFLDLPAVADPFVQEFADGPLYVRSQIIVDLHQWPLPAGVVAIPSIDEAGAVAANLNATVAGYLPATNSFALELSNPPATFAELLTALDAAKQQTHVADAWMDIAMDVESTVADMDMIVRYLRNEDPSLHGREDAWAMDRIQAPAAWNLIDRFLGPGYLNNTPIWLALMDSGVDHTHPDWLNAPLITLDAAGNEQPYTGGDTPGTHQQHGTRVASLIAAQNNNIVDAATGDRGMNGLVPDDPFLLQGLLVFPRSVPAPGPTVHHFSTAARFAHNINHAANYKYPVRAMNISMSLGQPVAPPGPHADRIQLVLLRLASLIRRYENRMLLVAAAGNQNTEVAEYDLVHDPTWPATKGYHVLASLGTLPNVIAVGAIGGPNHNAGPGPAQWAYDDQRAPFSNFGSPVSLYAPGTHVFAAGGGPGGILADNLMIGGAKYTRSNGTSYAAPLVTGTAAMVSVVNPRLRPAEIKQLLIDTAFPVVTTDGYGDPHKIVTLKAGYAVRQAMLDRGIIQNDQPWTGVSKIVTGPHEPYYEGLHLFEIRRGPDGRAEGFALRQIQPPGRQAPTIRHDGKTVAYYHTTGQFPQDFTIREYDFKSGIEVVIEGPHNETNPFPQGQWLGGNSFTLDFSARNDLLWYHGMRPSACGYTHLFNVRDAASGIDQIVFHVDVANGCGLPNTYWEAWNMNRASWRPNSRRFDFGYGYTDGIGGNIIQQCWDDAAGVPQVWYRDADYAPGIIHQPPPGCPGPGPGNPSLGPERVAWSQDGRARIAFMPGNFVHTRYYNQAGNQMVERARVELPDVRWSFWSPDGSEAAILQTVEDPKATFSNFITIRRDIRDVADRNPTPLIFMPGHKVWTFSWQW